MRLPIFQTSINDLNMLQTKWASQINPLLNNPLSTGYILKNVSLVSGDNTINHLQDKVLNGYVVVSMREGFSQIYEKTSTMPKKTLVLNASAPVTVDILVF